MRKSLLITLFSACFLASHADEGMWMLTDLKKQNAAVMPERCCGSLWRRMYG